MKKDLEGLNFDMPERKVLPSGWMAPDDTGDDSLSNPTRLTHWFPRIPDTIQVPRTEIIEPFHSLNVFMAMDGDEDSQKLLAGAVKQVVEAGNRVGWPCFLRTDITSAKHSWKDTCYLGDPDDAAQHIMALVHDAECAGAEFSLALVVREMLPTVSTVTAFHGEMPITKERRYFVVDGSVVCHHPYWPEEAFEGRGDVTKGWRQSLHEMNREPEEEVAYLTGLSEKVSRAIPGEWSVDWLWTTRGWYLIDMAEAGRSYHFPGCKEAR